MASRRRSSPDCRFPTNPLRSHLLISEPSVTTESATDGMPGIALHAIVSIAVQCVLGVCILVRSTDDSAVSAPVERRLQL